VTGLERLRKKYKYVMTLEKYVILWNSSVQEIDGLLLQERYLFRFHKLYISRTSLKDFLS